MKVRWQMRETRPPGRYTITTDGKEPLDITVDENGIFETEGLTNHPIFAFAKLIPVCAAPSTRH
jgi:hypothetical protein